MGSMTTPELPADFPSWPLERKNAFIKALRYNWDFWARPEQLIPNLNDPWDIWMILSGRGWGKLLPLNTLISTPDGFTTMGEISVGDTVYAPDGTTTLVTGAFDTQTPDKAYEIKFNDGTSVISADTHEWVTWTRSERKKIDQYPSKWWGDSHIRSTQELFKTQTVGSRKDSNHSIPLVSIDGVKVEFSIDPYVLGVWLGDGATHGAEVTIGEIDQSEMRSQLANAGHETTPYGPIQFGISGLRSHLRKEGLLGSKHVPNKLLRGSFNQRLALVQGLMDTDGGVVSGSQYVEFCTTSPTIAESMLDLLWSLGQAPRAKWYKNSYVVGGVRKIAKDKCRIKFRPTVQVFRLSRKANQIGQSVGQARRHTARMISSVVPTPVVPMRCISVAHESRMYLVGREMIPTHNTRTGAEAIKKLMLENPGCRIGIIGMTAGAVRDTCYEGESGLVVVMPSDEILKYNRSLGQLTLKNGSRAFSFSGSDPEKLRGFQSNYLWMDELCAFSYPQEAWDMSLMGLRLGDHPRIIITTTPKPSKLILELVERGQADPEHVVLTTGSTFDNAANLPVPTLAALRARYEGTTMGRQELYAELIMDDPGALWNRPLIEDNRVQTYDLKDMAEIVVAIDPSMAVETKRDTETGMVVAGRSGKDGKCYIIEDCSRLRPSPQEWGQLAIAKYHEYRANKIVAEVNQGYDLVDNLLSTIDSTVPLKKVYATRGGKFLRAEPIAALYEQGKVKHVGMFNKLEDQMTQWIPGKPSPDRLDAMVWAVTQLMLGGGIAEFFNPNNSGIKRLPGIV